MTDKMYFEDFAVGQVFRAGPIVVTADAITTFAKNFDPQPFHLDAAAAVETFFQGLAASGWHTAAITMRLLVDGGLPVAGGIIGNGIDELRWLRPVRPGDALSVESEIVELRESKLPGKGRMRAKSTTRDQNGEIVQSFIASMVVPRRQPVEAAPS